jgi:hypothetical protein
MTIDRLAFTVGKEASYDQALTEVALEGRRMHKLGRCPDPDGSTYNGGYVFRTLEDAAAFVDDPPASAVTLRLAGYDTRTWGIYELELPGHWDACTGPSLHDQDGVARLLVSAPVTRKARAARGPA